MGEEIEIIKVAMQGTEMSFRLAGTSTKEALKFLKFIVTLIPNISEWLRETSDKNIRRKMTKAEWKKIKEGMKDTISGQVDFKKLVDKFGHDGITCLNIPDQSLSSFSKYAKEYNLSYSVLPDLNSNDGMTQVVVPVSENDIFRRIIKKLEKEELERNERAKTKLEEDKNKAEENLSKARAEKKAAIEAGKHKGDPEYDEAVSKEFTAERELNDLMTEYKTLDKRTHECGFDEYINTNAEIFQHVDFCNELKKQGISVEDKSSISSFVKPISSEELNNKDEISNTEYIVNPESNTCIKKEAMYDEDNIYGMKYTMYVDEKERYSVEYTPTSNPESLKNLISLCSIKERDNLANQGKEYNIDEQTWFVLNNKEDVIKFYQILKKNSEEVEKPEIKEKTEKILGNDLKEQIKNEKKEENVIQLPEDIKYPESYKGRFGIFTKNNNQFIEIDKDVIKKKSDNLVIVADKDKVFNITDIKSGSVSKVKGSDIHQALEEVKNSTEQIKKAGEEIKNVAKTRK